MLFSMGQKPIFGLDIGSSAIKVVQLQKKGDSYVVNAFHSVPLPEDTIVDGEILNSSALSDALKTVLKESSIKAKNVCCSLAGAFVIIKHISIPKVDARELEDQVFWEAEQYIPFDMKEISLAFEVVSEDSGGGKMDILLVAAKKDFIEKRIALLQEQGLQTEIVDVDVLALANVFWENYELSEGNAAVLVDIGANLTKVNIVSKDATLFTRDIAVGGKNLTTEIQNKLGVSFDEAEVLKVDAANAEQAPAELQPIIAAVSENIALEIRRSLDFFTSSSTQHTVSGIYLCGGSSKIPGLSAMLGEMLGLPIEFLNPFQRITYKGSLGDDFMNDMAQTAVVSIGLGMRELE